MAAAVVMALLLAMPVLASAESSMVVQPDGKIVLTGAGQAGHGWGDAIVRFNQDGTLDKGFGFGGSLLDFRGGGSFGPVTVQLGGRIVVAGGSSGVSTLRDVGYLLRGFQPAGNPDLEFGESGVAAGPAIEPSWTTTPSVIQARPDGGLVVGGSVFRYVKVSRASKGVAQLFGHEGGFGETLGEFPRDGQSGLGSTWLSDLLQRSDGSLVAVGSSEEHLGSQRVLLGRFLPGSGVSYDASFAGGAGFALFNPYLGNYPELLTRANAVVASEGRLILVGTAQNRVLLVGFDEEGNLDTAFGEDGSTVAVLDGSMFAEASAAMVQEDGKVVIAGKTWDACASEPALGCWSLFVARFSSDGSLDPSFGFEGFTRVANADVREKPQSIDVAPSGNGKILVSGETTPGPSWPERSLLTVARFASNGSLDPSFGTGGIASTSACPGTVAELRKTGCLASARARLRARGLRSARPRLRLRVESTELLDPLRNIRFLLPRTLETRGKVTSRRIQVSVIGGKPGYVNLGPRKVALWQLGKPRAVAIGLPTGTLRAIGRRGRARKLAFHVKVWFQDGSEQTIVLRR